MARKPETRFKEDVVYPALEKIPGLWFVKVQQLAIRGTPDIIICHKGKFLAWELKVDNNKADALQEYTLGKIREAGGIGHVVTPENFKQILGELLCL